MDLRTAIENGMQKYEQRFLVVHVQTEKKHERFTVTKMADGFPEYNCYDIRSLIKHLQLGEHPPKRVGVTNSPFGFVHDWTDVSRPPQACVPGACVPQHRYQGSPSQPS